MTEPKNEDELLHSAKKTMTEEEVAAEAEDIERKYKEYLRNKELETKEIKEYYSDYTPGMFDHTMTDFILNNPFMGSISMSVTKVIDIKQPTAYIGVRHNTGRHDIVMGINPKFFAKHNIRQRHGVIKHELYHLIFKHVLSRAIGDTQYAMMWNWATDLAINSIIGKENLPESCLIPGQRPLVPAKIIDPATGLQAKDPKTGKPMFDENKLEPSEGPYADFIEQAPPGQASDYYFEGLRKIQDEQGDGDNSIAIGSGIGTMDGHDNWDDLPAEVQEQLKEKINELVSKGVTKADRDNSWGDIPQEIREAIRNSISREIDWKSILKNFIGRCRSTDRNSTVKRINKKMPYIHPGVKRPFYSKFAIFIDQSGSVCDEDLCLFFGELENLSKEIEIDVWHFDTEVDKQSKTIWKKSQPAPAAHRTRCGGTDFQCVVDFMNSRENRGVYSGVIICTDGYAGTPGNIVNARTLWVITESGTTNAIPKGHLYAQMKKEKSFKKI